jgi:hypothetical protein
MRCTRCPLIWRAGWVKSRLRLCSVVE